MIEWVNDWCYYCWPIHGILILKFLYLYSSNNFHLYLTSTIYYRGRHETSHFLEWLLFSVSPLWIWPLTAVIKSWQSSLRPFSGMCFILLIFTSIVSGQGCIMIFYLNYYKNILATQFQSLSFSISIDILKLWFCNVIRLFRKPWMPYPTPTA